MIQRKGFTVSAFYYVARGERAYRHLANSAQAPQCILNSRISRNRRFATQTYRLQRLKAIGAKHDATLNDVASAIISGGLRNFLGELGELPEKPKADRRVTCFYFYLWDADFGPALADGFTVRLRAFQCVPT